MNLTPEQKVLLGALFSTQVGLSLLYAGRAVLYWLVILLNFWNQSTHLVGDWDKSLVEIQNWWGWMLLIDPELLAVVVLLSQYFLVALCLIFGRPRRHLPVVLLVGVLALWPLFILPYSCRHASDDERIASLVFCAAYLAPLFFSAWFGRHRPLRLSRSGSIADVRWHFNLRFLFVLILLSSVAMLFTSYTNTRSSPRWVDALANGFLWGICLVFVSRRLLIDRRLLPALALMALAVVGTSLILVNGVLLTRGISIQLFGSRWMANVHSEPLGLLRGVIKTVGWNVGLVTCWLLVLRWCGWRLVPLKPAAKRVSHP